jgi:hypothetical protein
MPMVIDQFIQGLFRLFECIGAVRGVLGKMKKGSTRDYDAETGCIEQPAQKSQLPFGRTPFVTVKGHLRFPLTVTYHGCPAS